MEEERHTFDSNLDLLSPSLTLYPTTAWWLHQQSINIKPGGVVMRRVSARAEGALEGEITIEAMAIRAPLSTLLQLTQALVFRRQRWNDRRAFLVRVRPLAVAGLHASHQGLLGKHVQRAA
jgi:hypothetical protein